MRSRGEYRQKQGRAGERLVCDPVRDRSVAAEIPVCEGKYKPYPGRNPQDGKKKNRNCYPTEPTRIRSSRESRKKSKDWKNRSGLWPGRSRTVRNGWMKKVLEKDRDFQAAERAVPEAGRIVQADDGTGKEHFRLDGQKDKLTERLGTAMWTICGPNMR